MSSRGALCGGGSLEGALGVWGAGKGAACVLGWGTVLVALTCCGDRVEVEAKCGFLLRPQLGTGLGAPGVCPGRAGGWFVLALPGNPRSREGESLTWVPGVKEQNEVPDAVAGALVAGGGLQRQAVAADAGAGWGAERDGEGIPVLLLDDGAPARFLGEIGHGKVGPGS